MKNPVRSISWRSADADEISSGLSSAIGRLQVRPINSKHEIDVSFDFAQCQNVKVWYGACASGMLLTPQDPLPLTTLHLPIDGRANFSHRNKELNADQSTGVIFDGEDMGLFRCTAGYDHVGLTIFREVLENHLANLLDTPLKTRLRFDQKFLTSEASASLLTVLVGAMVDDARANLEECPFTAIKLSETILTLLLEGFSHNYSDVLKFAAKRTQSTVAPRFVKRAIALMEAEADRPLSIPEIAAKANVSVRTLQYGFRQHAGVSPLHYLQMVRLDRAIEEIANAPPATTISEIAFRWGFSNPARFASLCVKRTGFKPSELRKRNKNL